MSTPVPVPSAARSLGAAGLLPTLAALAAVAFGGPALAAAGFAIAAIYGAAILSFLGGAWWGIAAARAPEHRLGALLAVAVLPSLLAAGALWALSPLAVAVLGLAFLGAPAVDRLLLAEGFAPPWWLSLRLPLSAAMGVLHLAVAALHVLRGGAPIV